MENEKHPKEMCAMELLEKYSHLNRKGYHTIQEQDYIALVRAEILKRMESHSKA